MAKNNSQKMFKIYLRKRNKTTKCFPLGKTAFPGERSTKKRLMIGD